MPTRSKTTRSSKSAGDAPRRWVRRVLWSIAGVVGTVIGWAITQAGDFAVRDYQDTRVTARSAHDSATHAEQLAGDIKETLDQWHAESRQDLQHLGDRIDAAFGLPPRTAAARGDDR